MVFDKLFIISDLFQIRKFIFITKEKSKREIVFLIIWSIRNVSFHLNIKAKAAQSENNIYIVHLSTVFCGSFYIFEKIGVYKISL